MKLLLAASVAFLMMINPAGSAETNSFDAFWIRFKAAVAKGNKAAIAEMTKLPFAYDDKQLSKEEFVKHYGAIFGKKVQKCFSNAKPAKADNRESYSVFCGETIFVFEKVSGEYRFTDVGVND